MTEEFNENDCDLDKYGPYLDIFRGFFVSSLESRIYDALETFVYSDAELSSQFPNLKKCLSIFNAIREIYHSTSVLDAGVLYKLIKCLIKDGLITTFINAILLSSRLNRICWQLDEMKVEKHFLKFLDFSNNTDQLENITSYNSSIKRAIKRKASSDINDTSIEQKALITSTPMKSSITREKKIIRKISACRLSSCFYNISKVKLLPENFQEKNLRLEVKNLENERKQCIGCVESMKIDLPCESKEIINIISSDPSVMLSCFGAIRRQFKMQIKKICAKVNTIIGKIDRKKVKKCVLHCKIVKDFILFKLKRRSGNGSRSYLFADRVCTRAKISAEKIQRNMNPVEIEGPEALISDCREGCDTWSTDEDFVDAEAAKGTMDELVFKENKDIVCGEENIELSSSFYSLDSSRADKTLWLSACENFQEDTSFFTGETDSFSISGDCRLESSDDLLKKRLLEILQVNSTTEIDEKPQFTIAEDESVLTERIFCILKSIFDAKKENSKDLHYQKSTEESLEIESLLRKYLEKILINSKAEITMEKSTFTDDSGEANKTSTFSQTSSERIQLSDNFHNCRCQDRITRSVSTQTAGKTTENPDKLDLQIIVSPISRDCLPNDNINLAIRKTSSNSLICILEETEERMQRCLTSSSEMAPLTSSDSGTFIIERKSSGSKLSSMDEKLTNDLLDNLQLIQNLSSPLSSRILTYGYDESPTKKSEKADFNQDSYHFFLRLINKHLKIIIRRMYRHFRLIFSPSAFDRLRYLIKKKLYRLLVEREKSTNTSATCFSVKRRRVSAFDDHSPANSKDQRVSVRKNSENKCFELRKNSTYKIPQNELNVEAKCKSFEKNQPDFRRNIFRTNDHKRHCCTCCSYWIDAREHFGSINCCQLDQYRRRRDLSIYQSNQSSCPRIKKHRDYCYCQLYSQCKSRKMINHEFRRMLIEHVNLCKSVRNSLIGR